jgi:hypothetical protein
LIISDPFWIAFWLVSAIVGEVGLIFRFVGATFFLAFAYLIVTQNKFPLSHLRRAIILEGSYYLFMVPFILSLFLRPNTSIENLQAGASYTLQLLLISPTFIILYLELKKPNLDKPEVFKWGAICVIGFTFALWVKHFFMTLYALPINLGNSVLAIGFLNSALTILIAGFILSAAFLHVIRKQSLIFNQRTVGIGFLLTGLHFVFYILVSLFSQQYWDFMILTELWAVAFLILAVGYIKYC